MVVDLALASLAALFLALNAKFTKRVVWAYVQQMLFQFYLLGRLLTLLPRLLAVALAAIGFSLVHCPEWGVVAATAGLGALWSLLYYRYRRLLPIAISHACLGAAFFYWIYGQDLALEWKDYKVKHGFTLPASNSDTKAK